MFSVVLIVLFPLLILAASTRFQRPEVDHRLTILLLLTYAIRLLVAPFTHTAAWFTGGAAGVDSSGYEGLGAIIAQLWRYTGIHYVTGNELPGLESVSLPPNVYAVVIYLNGGPAHMGCVAVVAAVASFVCLNLHLLSLQLGARRDVALAVTGVTCVLPSFFYYTSDTYKDVFVAFFALGILGCSLRLARKFSFLQLAWAVVLMGGLWTTRFYLVYAMPAPLLLGLLGLRSGSAMRTILAVLVIAVSLAAIYAYSDVPAIATDHAVRTFRGATSEAALSDNATRGSGVAFDSSSPTGSFLPRLAYTLFSPFPWQAGSLGLQIGKIDAFLWYYFFYRAVRAGRVLWRERRSDLILFVSFIVPMTVAYAFSFSNVGLIVRERINIVLATIVLASLSWSARRAPAPDRHRLHPIAAAARRDAAGRAATATERGRVADA